MDFGGHLLSVITFTPLVGAALLLLPFFKGKDDAVRWFANAVGLAGFLVSLPPWTSFGRSPSSPVERRTSQSRPTSCWTPTGR